MKSFKQTVLPQELEDWREKIEAWAKEYGLDCYQTIFEVLDWQQMNMVASYGGFPNRYPHWRFGMEYEQMSKSYAYGLSKIYELVINNDPCYAYLLHCNKLVDQKMVMAHVFGHCDFFKNNTFFGPTPKNMMDQMANHKTRVMRYIDRLGHDRVEEFIDNCLSIENLIDYQRPFQSDKPRLPDEEEGMTPSDVAKIHNEKDYLEEFINPQAFVDLQRQKKEETEQQSRQIPERPERDIMGFLLEYAPLSRWEYDILNIVRKEAYYFAPQAQTKIMNEGWACVAPDTLVFTEKGLISMQAVLEESAQTVSDGQVNQRVYDQNIIKDHQTVTIKTRRGLTLTGSNNHRILREDGETWVRLDEVQTGDKIQVSGGQGLWPEECISFDFDPMKPVVAFQIDNASATYDFSTLQEVPGKILRSPKSVVVAFLKAYFDCDGYAGKQGVILSSASEKMVGQVQLLLMNFGILSRVRKQKTDGCYHLHIMGASAKRFFEEIGFGIERKQEALSAYLSDRQWYKKEDWSDEIVEISTGRGDVYDISVENTHRYVAAGLVNHNSYWHSTIMTQKALEPNEFIDFAENHSGAMVMGQSLNPYKIGIELFRDIEERWNKGQFGKEFEECDNMVARQAWDTGLGEGRKKIFEVRKIYNDITFIDEFFTADFCRRFNLFAYQFNPLTNRMEISDRDFEKVKTTLLTQLTNFGQPLISVVDANHGNRGELRLVHTHEGVDLDMEYANHTLRALHAIWKRPVLIETKIGDKKKVLTFDGSEHKVLDTQEGV